ncbi:ectropic viral integration site 2A protein, partial [Oesophagostomum dentatum]
TSKPTAVAPPTASTVANTTGTSSPCSSSTSPSKCSSTWTNQKKLAAQSMITNVAGLASFKGRVGELQEILRKVANETISYEDFVKWHDSSMKSVPPKPSSDHKAPVNGVVRPSSSASNPVKSTAHASSTTKEQPVLHTSKSSGNVSAVPVKRITLAQAMASSSAPTQARPLTLTSAQIADRFERDKQETIRAISVAIENSKSAHKKKSDAAAAAGKPAPKYEFLWTENLAKALRTQLDLYWSIILGSDSFAHAADGILTIIVKEVFPLFHGEIKLSRLLVEYTRRSPERAFLLASSNIQRLLKDDGIDLNNINVVTKKEKTDTDADSSKVKSSRSFTTILPVKSSSDDIQSSTSHKDADVVVVEPSTSSASTSNGDAAAASTPSTSKSSAAAAAAASATNQAVDALNGTGLNMTPAQIAEITAAMQRLSALTTDPQQLLVLQQTFLMQMMTHNQVEVKRKQEEEKRKEEERKRKLAEEEKEAKRRAKEEEKLKLIAQKKALAQCAKEKALEEKRLRMEEEKKQKLAEKARKEEVNSWRRLCCKL